jgi:hypothetical protein
MLSPPNSYQSHRLRRRLVTLLLLLVWFGLLALLLLNRQNIADYLKLRNYNPPVAISTLANQDTMTAYGRRIFYVNHPVLDDKTAFNLVCPNNGGEQTIVLGCYHSDQDGIFLLSVSDPRLNGVEQVTAAHEMLHGAYDRLSRAERKKVDAMLLNYYNHDLKDQRIKNVIAAYRKTEPTEVVNEMHSVFGTEVANLPAPLEQYYKRYFTDRHQITEYAAQYEAEFTSRQNAVTQDDAQLATMKSQIDAAQADLKSKLSVINAQQASLLAERSSGNVTAYNAGVPPYNSLVDAYNADVQSIQSQVASYNQLVTTRNDVALEEDELVKDLTGNAQTINN